MRNLVGYNPLQLVISQKLEYSFCSSDSSMLGAPAGCKGVALLRWNDIDLGHRDACNLADFLDSFVKLGMLVLDFPGPVHGQDHLVGKPVRAQVHQEGEY